MNIIAGDMNCVSSIHYDTLGHTRGEVLVGSSELESLVISFGCSDPYRRPPGALKNEFTWFSGSAASAIRLDKFFVPRDCASSIKSEFFPYSDHKILHCSIKITTSTIAHGKSFWKLNNSILQDDVYIDLIKNLIEDCRSLRLAFKQSGNGGSTLKRELKT